eukprot:TRINITY_DN2492_c0_g1_i1.p1 TRINITY_DN2492_c0_g1~~TRINITY_DN2492_c0_g1_i1.p1  ORF type:complete len:154 (+),score=46.07 TRINITY_DN2492_c0_g1_i1:295-756(+)
MERMDWGIFEGDTFVQGRVRFFKEEKINSLYQQLNTVIEELFAWLEDMKKTYDSLQNISDTTLTTFGSKFTELIPLFGTITLSKFVSLMDEIVTLYSSDLLMKKSILLDVRKQRNQDTLNLYIFSWMSCPVIDKDKLAQIHLMVDTEISCLKS